MVKIDLRNFPTSPSAKKMMSYISRELYAKSYVGKWIFEVMGIELDTAWSVAKDLPGQLFVETATWGLTYHEAMLGLPVRPNLSYEERRKLIYQKRDYRAPMTPYRMEKYLENATGFEVHISDVHDPGEYGFVAPHPNVFKAYFLGEGTLNSKLVHEILDRLKQSHTIYTVNDRIEIELDNRDLEQIVLRNVHFWMLVPFWYEYVYDGSWLLDGSVILGQKRRYGLVLGLKFKQGGFYTQDQIRLILVKFEAKTNIDEFFNARGKYRFGISFWNIICFDGTWNLDGSVELDKMRKYCRLSLGIRQKLDMLWLETVANATVKTRSRNCWFLDGSLLLDGTRNLNSIYKKEEVK